jgi:hypothetical protein
MSASVSRAVGLDQALLGMSEDFFIRPSGIGTP